jgi:hypothetical protein
MAAKLGCEDINPKEINFKQPKSILAGLLNLFKIPTSVQTTMPKQLILASKSRPGLSAKLMASRVIQRQAEAGLNVGPLGTGEISPAEIMEKIRMEEIVNAISTEMKIDLAITPGGKSAVTGTAGPLPVVGNAVIVDIMGGSAVAS